MVRLVKVLPQRREDVEEDDKVEPVHHVPRVAKVGDEARRGNLEELEGDAELRDCLAYMPHAFIGTTIDCGLLAHISKDDGSTLDLAIGVGPDGVTVKAGANVAEIQKTVEVTCERVVPS